MVGDNRGPGQRAADVLWMVVDALDGCGLARSAVGLSPRLFDWPDAVTTRYVTRRRAAL